MKILTHAQNNKNQIRFSMLSGEKKYSNSLSKETNKLKKKKKQKKALCFSKPDLRKGKKKELKRTFLQLLL